MLSSMDLLQLKVRARDGDIGTVHDMRFSDSDWTVRDIAVDTGSWIFGRRVVIDPDVVLEPDMATAALNVDLTHDEVKALPEPIDEGVPSSIRETPPRLLADGHLHSLREVEGFALRAGDVIAGSLVGFLIDTVAWDLPLALVRLARSETIVLLPSRLISAIAWPERSIQASIEPSRLQNAPTFDPRIEDDRVYLPVVTDYYASLSAAA